MNKLTSSQISYIRTAYAHGTKQKELAQQYSVSQAHISKIVTGMNYASVPAHDIGRFCLDCGTQIHHSGKRCTPCRKQHNATQNSQYRKQPPTRRYRTVKTYWSECVKHEPHNTDGPHGEHVVYRQEYKSSWYAHWIDSETGKHKRRYVGQKRESGATL